MDFAARLAAVKAAHLYRTPYLMESAQGREVVMDGRRVLLFCSNSYLGLNNRPEILRAAVRAVDAYGVGAGAVAVLQKDRAAVKGYGGAGLGKLGVVLQGLEHVGFGLRKSAAFGQGHGEVIIEVGVVRGQLEGTAVFGDGVLPAALAAQAEAQPVEEGDVVTRKKFFFYF